MKGRILWILVFIVILAAFGCQTKSSQAEIDHSVALTQWSEKLEEYNQQA